MNDGGGGGGGSGGSGVTIVSDRTVGVRGGAGSRDLMTAVARGKGEGPTFILVKDQVKLLE